jgi:acyl-CoA thioester hydrolase
MRFSHSFRVRSEDIDAQGHVNNVAYLRWIQDIAVAHWLYAATAEQQANYGWVVVRHEIDYKRQAFENEEITTTTWVGEWSKVTCERFTEITRDGEILAKGRTVWCMLDRETAKPARIASDLIERFA